MGNIVLAKAKEPKYDFIASIMNDEPAAPEQYQGFLCPMTKAPLNVCCGVGKCRFHIPFEWAKNCLLQYITHHGVESLSPEEISYLYSIPIQDVHKTIEDTMQQMRSMVLSAARLENSDYNPTFGYVKTSGICCVCESTIFNGERIEVADGLAYCSQDCADEIPPEVIGLQQKYGLNIEPILKWALQSFRKSNLACQALELTPSKFKRLCRRYLKIDVAQFYSSDTCGTETIYDNVVSFIDRASNRYGSPHLDLNDVSAAIAAL